ncbi:hypothetical protein JCM3766R1_003921 [Sporobolomyces carnicolor]
MSRSTRSTPAPSAPPYQDESSSDAIDYGRLDSKTPGPPTRTRTKPPTVLKVPRDSRTASNEKPLPEPLVKSSRKSKADSSKGSYAPVPVAGELHSSSDEGSNSDFSDPENAQTASTGRGAAGGAHPQEHEFSDEEQEEEKEGRPLQTPAEKRKRTIMIALVGGLAVVILIAILVTIMLLHSKKSGSDDAKYSSSLNSTAGGEHSANSTSSHNSTMAHNSTSSHNATSSHGANSSISEIEDTSRTATALPTNGTAVHGVEETDSFASVKPTSNTDDGLHNLSGTQTNAAPTENADIAKSEAAAPSPTLSGGGPSEATKSPPSDENESALDSDRTSPQTRLGSDTAQGVTVSTPTATQPSDLDQTTAHKDDDHQTTDGRASQDPGVLLSTPEVNVFTPLPSPNPVVTLTPIDTPQGALPSEYLRPAPRPQVPDVGAPDQASLGGSAWWPVPTVAANPNLPDESAQKSTKWVGKATWFDPGQASRSCQTDYKDSDFVVAISTEIYGEPSSISTFCGAKIHVWNEYTNQTRTGTVLAACEDCQGPTDINLSQSLFSELDNPDIGVQWWFDDPLVEQQTIVDLSQYESTAQKPKKYETTAIFWKETGWKSSCGKTVEDDSLYLGLPLDLWSDPSTSSELCGKSVTVKNVETGSTIDAEVVEASNRTEYTTFTKHAFEQLGGVADDGELAVEFWFK